MAQIEAELRQKEEQRTGSKKDASEREGGGKRKRRLNGSDSDSDSDDGGGVGAEECGRGARERLLPTEPSWGSRGKHDAPRGGGSVP